MVGDILKYVFTQMLMFVLLVFVAGILFGVFLGILIGSHNMRKAALENNAAHYTIEPSTGKRTYTWGPQ